MDDDSDLSTVTIEAPPLRRRSESGSSSRVILWITGAKRKDTTLHLYKTHNGFKALFLDRELHDRHHRYTFRKYGQLRKYLETLFENIHTDEDDRTPYTHIQWDIPGFTNSIIEIGNIDEANIQRTFFKLLEFYFNHRSTFL